MIKPSIARLSLASFLGKWGSPVINNSLLSNEEGELAFSPAAVKTSKTFTAEYTHWGVALCAPLRGISCNWQLYGLGLNSIAKTHGLGALA